MTKNLNFKQNNMFNTMSNGFTIPSFTLPELKTPNINTNNTQNNSTPTNNTTPPITPPAQETINPPPSSTQEKDTFTKDGTTNSQDEKGKKPLGKVVLISMLSVGAVALLLTKGISGTTANKIRRWVDKKENELLRYASKNRTANFIDEKFTNFSQSIKNIFSFSTAIANVTAIKDSFTQKITSWKPLNKFRFLSVQRLCNFFTRNILKVTESAVDSKYKIAQDALEQVETIFLNTLSKAKIEPSKAGKIKELIESIYPTYRKGFSKNTRNIRLQNIHTALKDLNKDVFNALVSPFKKDSPKGSFKKVYSSYITQNLQAPAQKAHKTLIDNAKIAISNNLDDVSTRMQSVTGELKAHFNTKDKECRLLYGDLLEKIETFKTYSSKNDAKMRDITQKEILSTLDKIREKFTEFSLQGKKGEIIKYSEDEIAKLSTLVSSLKEVITNSSEKGLLQKILTELKGNVDEKTYKILKNKVSEFNNSLNKAIDLEGGNMFDKIAEAKVGSIPTDMLGIGATIGGGAWAVSRGKDKNEKIGATLKVGIPLLGSICTYFYSTARAFSGTTNIAFGLATMYILNKIGSSIFDYYQKRFVENKTVKEIAQDVYNNATKT